MNLNEYQREALKTAVYPNIGNNYIYPALGLAGESGEYCEKIKKVIRDDNGKLDKKRDELIKELGDVMWYVAVSAHELNVSLEDVCKRNNEKLSSRKKRNKIQGSGDNR